MLSCMILKNVRFWNSITEAFPTFFQGIGVNSKFLTNFLAFHLHLPGVACRFSVTWFMWFAVGPLCEMFQVIHFWRLSFATFANMFNQVLYQLSTNSYFDRKQLAEIKSKTNKVYKWIDVCIYIYIHVCFYWYSLRQRVTICTGLEASPGSTLKYPSLTPIPKTSQLTLTTYSLLTTTSNKSGAPLTLARVEKCMRMSM